MRTQDAALHVGHRRDRLLAALAASVPAMRARALELDRDAMFPAEDIDALRDAGALTAPLPVALGGLGMGTESAGARHLLDALRLIGSGSLSVGRLFEAHVNALRLITRYGDAGRAQAAADDVLAGHLFGLWVTDGPDAPVRLTAAGTLIGTKSPCSGAGNATRALITAQRPDGETYLVTIALAPGERADPAYRDVSAMRAAVSGRVTLDGLRPSNVIGAAGDYLRQPDFSAGAWRTSAVALGGLEALVGELRAGLVTRRRDGDPHQLARVGEALIAQETARMWVWRAAAVAEAAVGAPDDIVGVVNLARVAVETACLDAIRIVQRGLGMSAFRRGYLAELVMRDLSLYLRQPAPDETLTEAAGLFMQRDLPALPQ